MSLLDEYRLLAMRADKRLQRLEKYSSREGYEEILQGSYARAILDIESWSGEGRKRFLTQPPKYENGEINERALRAKINDIKAFLRSDTSTLKPGLETRGWSVSRYESMAKTFNQRYGSKGAPVTWKDIRNYYQSSLSKKISGMIESSKSVAIALGEFKKLQQRDPKSSRAQIMRDIKSGKNVILSKDAVTNEIMKKMVAAGVSPRTIFKPRKSPKKRRKK